MPETFRNRIGPRVKEARMAQAIRLSQSSFARILQIGGLKIDRSAIAKIETGRRPVTDFELVAIAEALGVQVTWLLEGGDH